MDSLEFACSLLSGRRQDHGAERAPGGGKTGLYLVFTSFLMDPNESIGLPFFSVFIGCCELFFVCEIPSLYLVSL